MKSRHEVRVAESAPQGQTISRHHPVRTFWGMLALSLLIISLILSQTILSPRFIKQELHRSDLSSMVDDNLTSSLRQFGLTRDHLITKADTDHLLDQAVDQIYAGQSLKLDFNDVLNRAGSQVTQSVVGGSLPAGIMSSTTGSALTTALSQNLNSELNTEQVRQLTSWLQIIKVINQVVFWVSLIILLLVVIAATLNHQFLACLSWISTGSLIIVVGLIQLVKGLLHLISQNFPDYSAVVVQVTADFSHQAMWIWFGLVIVLLLSLVLRVGARWLKVGRA